MVKALVGFASVPWIAKGTLHPGPCRCAQRRCLLKLSKLKLTTLKYSFEKDGYYIRSDFEQYSLHLKRNIAPIWMRIAPRGIWALGALLRAPFWETKMRCSVAGGRCRWRWALRVCSPTPCQVTLTSQLQLECSRGFLLGLPAAMPPPP